MSGTYHPYSSLKLNRLKTLETRSFMSPNFMAPMEISTQQANVVGGAYQLVEELKDVQKAWYGVVREILEKAAGS